MIFYVNPSKRRSSASRRSLFRRLTPKQRRKYEHVKRSYLKRGESPKVAKRIASATAQKNPRRKSMPKKRRSAAQRAATKRMLAARWGRGRKRRRRNPMGVGATPEAQARIEARYARMRAAKYLKKGTATKRGLATAAGLHRRRYKKKLSAARRKLRMSRYRQARQLLGTRPRRKRKTTQRKRRTAARKRRNPMARTRRRRRRRNPVMMNPRKRRRRARRTGARRRRRRNPFHWFSGTGRWGQLENPKRRRRRRKRRNPRARGLRRRHYARHFRLNPRRKRRRARRNPSHRRRRRGVGSLMRARRIIRRKGRGYGRAARSYIARHRMRSNPSVGGVMGVLKGAVPVVLAMAAGAFAGRAIASKLPILSSLGRHADPALSIGLIVGAAILGKKISFLGKYQGAILTGLGINAVRSLIQTYAPASVKGYLGMGEYVAVGSDYAYDVGEYVQTGEYLSTGAEEDLAAYEELAGDAPAGMLGPVPSKAMVRGVPGYTPDFSEGDLYQGVFAGGF